MSKNEEEILSFYDFLEAREKEIETELAPYYEKLKEREEAHMNTYGLTSPSHEGFLSERYKINILKRNLKEVDSLEKLEEKLNIMDQEYLNIFLKYRQGFEKAINNENEEKKNNL